jgi:hypothetical protein
MSNAVPLAVESQIDYFTHTKAAHDVLPVTLSIAILLKITYALLTGNCDLEHVC